MQLKYFGNNGYNNMATQAIALTRPTKYAVTAFAVIALIWFVLKEDEKNGTRTPTETKSLLNIFTILVLGVFIGIWTIRKK